MDADESKEQNFASNLMKNALFRCEIYTSRFECSEFLLTTNLILYEIKGNNILSSCDLSSTSLKGKIRSENCSYRIDLKYSSFQNYSPSVSNRC